MMKIITMLRMTNNKQAYKMLFNETGIFLHLDEIVYGNENPKMLSILKEL